MGGVTGDKGYPYPTGSDRLMDGDNAIQALAQKVDNSIQAGTVAITTVADTPVSVAVTFARAYVTPPIVVLGGGAGPPSGSNYSMSFYASSITNTGFTAGAKRSNAQTVTAYWVAIGKPA